MKQCKSCGWINKNNSIICENCKNEISKNYNFICDKCGTIHVGNAFNNCIKCGAIMPGGSSTGISASKLSNRWLSTENGKFLVFGIIVFLAIYGAIQLYYYQKDNKPAYRFVEVPKNQREYLFKKLLARDIGKGLKNINSDENPLCPEAFIMHNKLCKLTFKGNDEAEEAHAHPTMQIIHALSDGGKYGVKVAKRYDTVESNIVLGVLYDSQELSYDEEKAIYHLNRAWKLAKSKKAKSVAAYYFGRYYSNRHSSHPYNKQEAEKWENISKEYLK